MWVGGCLDGGRRRMRRWLWFLWPDLLYHHICRRWLIGFKRMMIMRCGIIFYRNQMFAFTSCGVQPNQPPTHHQLVVSCFTVCWMAAIQTNLLIIICSGFIFIISLWYSQTDTVVMLYCGSDRDSRIYRIPSGSSFIGILANAKLISRESERHHRRIMWVGI